MDAALEVMFALGQVADLQRAALQDARLGHVDVVKTVPTLRSSFLSRIQVVDKAASELLHFGKGVGLAALVGHKESAALLKIQGIGFEVPALVRGAASRLGE